MSATTIQEEMVAAFEASLEVHTKHFDSRLTAIEQIVQKERDEHAGTDDPWKHRSAAMSCASCMWYVRKEASGPQPPNAAEVGRCRRHAPTMNGYPVVFRTDWCGDHKLDENKAVS